MVRIAARTLTLNVFRIQDSSLKRFLLDDTRSGTIRYFNRIVDLLIHWSCLLNEIVVALQTTPAQNRPRLIARFQATLDDLLDHFLYLNDVFSTGMEELNAQVSEILMDRLIWSLYFDSLAHHMIGDVTSATPKDVPSLPERPIPSNVFQQAPETSRFSIRLHPLTSLYLVALVISIFNKAPFIASLCQDLFSKEPTSTMQLRRIMSGLRSTNKDGNVLRILLRSFLEPRETNDALTLLALLIMQLTVEHAGLDSSALSRLDMMPRKLARKQKLMETLVSAKEETMNTTGIPISKRRAGSANLMVSRRPSSYPSSLSPMASAKLDDLGPLGQVDDLVHRFDDQLVVEKRHSFDPDTKGQLDSKNEETVDTSEDVNGVANDEADREEGQKADQQVDRNVVDQDHHRENDDTNREPANEKQSALHEKQSPALDEEKQPTALHEKERPPAFLRSTANPLLQSPPFSPSMRRPVAPTVALSQNSAAASTDKLSVPAYNEELVETLLLFLEHACVSFRSRMVTLQAALSFLIDLIYDPQQVKQTDDSLQTLLLPSHYSIWERFESAVLFRLSSALEDPRREADDQNTQIPWAPEDIVSLFRDPFHGETNNSIFDQMPNFQLDSRSLLMDGNLGGNIHVNAEDLLFPHVPVSMRNWTDGRRCVDSLERSLWADHVWHALFLVKSVKRVRDMLG